MRKPARTRPTTRCSRSDWASWPAGQDLAQAMALGLVMAGDQDPVRRGRLVQFVAQAADIAAEALDRLDAQVAGRFHGGAGKAVIWTLGKRSSCWNTPAPRTGPGSRRRVPGSACPAPAVRPARPGPSRRRPAGSRRGGPYPPAGADLPIAGWVTASRPRQDMRRPVRTALAGRPGCAASGARIGGSTRCRRRRIPGDKGPPRPGRRRPEAAAAAELAGQFDRLHALEAMFDQPGGQLSGSTWSPVRTGGAAGPGGPVRAPAGQGLDRGDHIAGRCVSFELLRIRRRGRRPRRPRSRRRAGSPRPGKRRAAPPQSGHVLRPAVQVTRVGENDQQGARRVQAQGRGRQAPRGTPGAVHGGAVAVLQGRDQGVKPLGRLHQARQLFQAAEGR